jgi:spermidine/putrescine ABC transporter ATP-binding subunit
MQLEIQNVTKHFGDVVAVDNISLSIYKGEFLTLLGPSGSGKTTTLNMIAGFETPTSGHIFLEGRDITAIPPHLRNIGMVFQNYALFPHMTVFNNVAFPLKMRKEHPSKIAQRVMEALEMVKLSGLERRYPSQLSGGQQQRVALARAIVYMPPLLLMDEPLGALDKKLRDHMRLEVKHLQQSLQITVVYVTHDQGEALTMSDRIAIMNEGRIVQVGTPNELYESPKNKFVADFIGESNFIEGRISRTEGRNVSIETEDGLVIWTRCPDEITSRDSLTVAVRPEKIQILHGDLGTYDHVQNKISGIIKEVIYLGESTEYTVSIGQDRCFSVKVQNGPNIPRYSKGDRVTIGWEIRHGLALE